MAARSRRASPGTAGTGLCDFTNLASGGYWVQEVSAPAGGVWNPILTWAPGSSSIDEPGGAIREPIATVIPQRTSGSTTNGFPLVVNGRPADNRDDRLLRQPADEPADRRPHMQRTSSASSSSSTAPVPSATTAPANYENAALAFVNDLVGTNTEIGIVSFAATAQSSGSLGSGYQNILGGPGTAASTVIGNVYDNLGGGTNWDARPAAGGTVRSRTRTWSWWSRTATRPSTSSRPDSASEVNWDDFTEAVTSANRLKAGDGAGAQKESRVFVVGAGAAGTISVENIWGIAGPVTGQANILANDYLIGSAEDLG